MKTLLDITPSEVDEFIDHFRFKGLATISKVNTHNSKVCEAPYEWAKDIEYKVTHHFNKWFDITIDTLNDPNIEITPKGFLFRRNEGSLTLFKLTRNGNDLIIDTFKKSFIICTSIIGIPSFQIPYFHYFISKGYSKISNRWVIQENGLIKEVTTYS